MTHELLPPTIPARFTHLLLQTRTKTLDGTLRGLFTRWYPAMAANDNQVAALAAAA